MQLPRRSLLTLLAATGLTGFLFQNYTSAVDADKEDVRSLQGDIVSRNWYDKHNKATLKFVIASTGIASAITTTTLSAFSPGVILNITACASSPDLVATTWEIQSGAEITGDITKSAEISLSLEKRPGITAVQAS